jgi:hypothetical protein
MRMFPAVPSGRWLLLSGSVGRTSCHANLKPSKDYVRNTSDIQVQQPFLDNIQASGLRDQLMIIKSENIYLLLLFIFLLVLEVMI